jgi:hypothetical protein
MVRIGNIEQHAALFGIQPGDKRNRIHGGGRPMAAEG